MAKYNKKDISLMKDYKTVFSGDVGRKVLKDLLLRLHVFSTIDPSNIQQVSLHNFGLWVLYQMGIVNDDTMEDVLDKLLSIDYSPKEQVDDET